MRRKMKNWRMEKQRNRMYLLCRSPSTEVTAKFKAEEEEPQKGRERGPKHGDCKLVGRGSKEPVSRRSVDGFGPIVAERGRSGHCHQRGESTDRVPSDERTERGGV